MSVLLSRRSNWIAGIRLLLLAVAAVVSICGCARPKPKSKKPDPVAIAERTRSERAVSEMEGTGTSEGETVMWENLLDEAKTLDYVLVEVNGEPITYGEVLRGAVERVGAGNWEKMPREEKRIWFQRSLQELIMRKLFLIESKELGYGIPESRVLAYVRSKIPEINKKYGGDIEEYAESKNVDYTELLKGYEDELLHIAYMQTNVYAKLNVSPEEVRGYYEQHQDEFHEKASAHMYAITLYKKGDPDKNAQVLETIVGIKAGLDRGEDFENLAREHTEDGTKREIGGDWGWVTYDQFTSEEINEALKELEVGEHSDVIETKVAYWIIKVAGKKAERTRRMGDKWMDTEMTVWDHIEEAIRKRKAGDLMGEEVGRLQKKYPVMMHGVSGRTEPE